MVSKKWAVKILPSHYDLLGGFIVHCTSPHVLRKGENRMNNGDILKAVFEHGIDCIVKKDDDGLAKTLNVLMYIIMTINEEEIK